MSEFCVFASLPNLKIHQIALSQLRSASVVCLSVLHVRCRTQCTATVRKWLRRVLEATFFLLRLRKLLHGPRVEDLSWHIPNHNFGSVTCSLIHGVRLCMCLHMCVWHTLHMYVFQAVRCTLCHLGSRGPLNQQSGSRNRRIKTARDSIHAVDKNIFLHNLLTHDRAGTHTHTHTHIYRYLVATHRPKNKKKAHTHTHTHIFLFLHTHIRRPCRLAERDT